ncbi:MAG: serine/threonine-protein kinase [Caldimonas sp.]
MSEQPSSDRTQVIGPPAADPAPSRLHQNALPVGAKLGEFEILDLVGEGGFGIVYLAQDHSLHRKVALKEYMPALLASRGQDASVAVRSERQRETFDIGLRSFVNEARMLAQFDHPALIKVYRFWEANGTAYMVMPFLSGQTLQDALRQRGEAPSEVWIRGLLSPLMDALAVLHDDKVYHRDIAPDNIMLLAGDRPVLLDFGAARRVISDMTHALTVILKPGYAPIEQYADTPGMKQGPWTDVYALAAVVYFMILKRKPPPAVSRLMEDSYQPLGLSEAAGRYSVRLLEGIDCCLKVRAEDRPQSMAVMREAIGLAASTDVSLAPPPAPQASGLQDERTVNIEAGAPGIDIDIAVDTAEPVASISLYADIESAPPPTKSSRLPLVVVGVLCLVVLVGIAAYFGLSKAPSVPPVVATVAAPAAVEVPAAAVVVAPAPAPAPTPAPAPRIASLSAAIEAAVAAADPRLAVTLEAPAAAAVGGELNLSLRSSSDGRVHVFVWDQAADRIYRLAADDQEGGYAVKANGNVAVKHRDSAKRAAKDPLGRWRVVSMLSERPRDFSTAAFVRDGDALVVERGALEARLAADGLPSLFGKPQCAAGEPCPDPFAIGVADVVQEAAAGVPAARRTPAPRPATRTPAPGKAPDSEREYMKRLNKDLDSLLGK